MKQGINRSVAARKGRRGMVLVGVMMVLMMIMAISLIGIGSNASVSDATRGTANLTRKRSASYQAQNLADTGIRAVLQWLNVQSAAPTNMSPFRPSQVATFWTGATVNGNYDRVTFNDPTNNTIGTIDVRVHPFGDNNTVTMRSYLVESVGTYSGHKQIVRAAIIQDTFAKYAFFSDYAPVNTWWTAGSTIFNGPVHVNARNMVSGTPDYDPNAAIKILWQNVNNRQIFKYAGDGAFTTAASSSQVKWYRGNQTTLAPPSGTTQWGRVAAGGEPTVKAGVAAVEMPTQSTRQQDAALGTPPATIPSGPSVTVPANSGATCGGIYVNGNVDDMKLTASGTNNTVQGIEIFQNDGTRKIKTVISIDPNSGADGTVTITKFQTANMSGTTYTQVGSPSAFAGRTNGVLYVNGNVGSPSVPPTGNPDGTPTTWGSGGVSGKVANSVVSGGTVTKQSALSIVTGSTNSVNISGDIVYASTSGGNAVTQSGILGIVSKKVQLLSNLVGDDMNDGLATVTVHATVMAYDTFNAEAPLNRPIANFNLLGGYIVKSPGTFAGIDNAGTQWTGFAVNRNYDSRVANTPPPFFPSTGNQYKIRSYQRVAATL
ncbi:MAG: hypothetical protein SFU56_09125 [Capsulimonadales bacterium]|nr:hypothetical protein [Capsulimonadales bacterium]